MEENKDPGIDIDSIILSDLIFASKINPFNPKELTLTQQIESLRAVDPDESKGKCILAMGVSESEGLISIHLRYTLWASVVEVQKNMELPIFLERHAPAILYQMTRETILSTSQKANLQIIIPPFNMKLLKQEILPWADLSLFHKLVKKFQPYPGLYLSGLDCLPHCPKFCRYGCVSYRLYGATQNLARHACR